MNGREQSLDWRKLPSALHYLIPAAEKYGRWSGDPEFYAAADALPDNEVASLAALADKMREGRAFDQMKAWLARYPINLHPEASLVYHLGLLLDYLDLPYE